MNLLVFCSRYWVPVVWLPIVFYLCWHCYTTLAQGNTRLQLTTGRTRHYSMMYMQYKRHVHLSWCNGSICLQISPSQSNSTCFRSFSCWAGSCGPSLSTASTASSSTWNHRLITTTSSRYISFCMGSTIRYKSFSQSCLIHFSYFKILSFGQTNLLHY